MKALVEDGHASARAILEKLRPALDAVAAQLQEKEVMSGEEVRKVLDEHASRNAAV